MKSSVYLIPLEKYYGNKDVEGEGTPPELLKGAKIENGCTVNAKLIYTFKDPHGNNLHEDQILDTNWKEEWVNEFINLYSIENTNKNNYTLLDYIENCYPKDNYPQTLQKKYELGWKLHDLCRYLNIYNIYQDVSQKTCDLFGLYKFD